MIYTSIRTDKVGGHSSNMSLETALQNTQDLVKNTRTESTYLLNSVKIDQLPWASNIISKCTVGLFGSNLLVSVNIKPILSAFE